MLKPRFLPNPVPILCATIALLSGTTAIEAQAQPRLMVGDVTVDEGDSRVRLPIRIEGESRGVQFSYTTVDGSAVAGKDYRAQSGSAGLSPGVSTFELDLLIFDDKRYEGDESFSIRVSSVSGAETTKNFGTVTIRDNDPSSKDGPKKPDGYPGPGQGPEGTPGDGPTSGNEFQDLFGGDEQNELRMAAVLDRTCNKSSGDHKRMCDFLAGLDPEKRARAIRALMPRGMTAQGDVTLRSQQTQLKNVSARQGQLRASVNNNALRGSLRQLTAELEGHAIPIDSVARALRAPSNQQNLAKALDRKLHALRKPAAAQGEDDELDERRVLREAGESRWGVFANGRFGDATHDGTPLEPGYDVDSYGGTIGVDYRLNHRSWLGVAFGYSDATTRLHDWDYELSLDGYSVSLYSGFQAGRFYVDGAITHGRLDFEVVRSIPLPKAFSGKAEWTATGQSDSDFTSATLSTGYDLSIGRIGTSAFVRGYYSDASVDPYQERGAPGMNLTFDQQQLDTGLIEAGFEVAYPISLSWGAVHPIFRASYLREFGDDSRQIQTGFLVDAENDRFRIFTDDPDRDYLNAAIGFHLTLARSRLFYLMAERDFERDDYEQTMYLFGFRMQLP